MMTTKRKRKMIKGRISGKIVMMMMMMKDINHLMMNMKIREEADTNMRRRNITGNNSKIHIQYYILERRQSLQ